MHGSKRFGRAAVMVAGLVVMGLGGAARAADPIEVHPAAAALKQVFEASAGVKDVRPTGMTRKDYLRLIAGNVDFFKKHQNAAGAIIDPVSKGERQYSTPAFALAAGTLVREAGRKDLLDPATRAMTWALDALVQKRSADGHSDFYIPLLVHAYRQLKDVVEPAQAEAWKAAFQKIDPETSYNARLRDMNWNIVSSSGELLRRHDGLVAPAMADAQMAYLERCLGGHMKRLMPSGLFEDPGVPMIYDAFSRLWLEDAMADGAYTGKFAGEIETFLRRGALSSLLLMSPSGEWASGGRSGLHNWGEAQMAAIFEINAVYWKKRGRDDVAGAFKRAARLSLESVARWQRPSGELWIIKNRAEPETRFAFEGYSHHSQYNLLPMGMLAIAYARADESIEERVTPSEVGGYVFDVRETFHKVAAAAGGYYVLIETGSDPGYNATGLQRVHRAGVGFPAFSDTVAGERSYQPKEAPRAAVSPGIEWKAADGTWVGLGDFSRGKKKRTVGDVKLTVKEAAAARVEFEVVYELREEGKKVNTVTERYVVDREGVALMSTSEAGQEHRVQFPVLVSDGATELAPAIEGTQVRIDLQGSTTTFSVVGEAGPVSLLEPRLVTHNGHAREAVTPVKSNSVTLRITLSGK